MAYYEIRLSGSGGQGMMLAGSFLAEAAGIYDNKYIVQTRSYGPESRGGASRSEVIVSSNPIGYPEVTKPDLVLAMTQEASDKYNNDLKAGGIMIVDPDYVKNKPAIPVTMYEIPLTRIARNEVGKEITANVVALGALSAVVDWVSKEAIKKIILERAPKGTADLNEKAFEAGYSAGRQLIDRVH
jgi:2-oxoglutarate ferredoxin oxidoreductase subunit gamma